jgi:phospholipase/carboxylesterase
MEAMVIYRINREQASRRLILLHGWSAEQHHLAAYVPLVDPDGRYSAICPRAPHDLPEGDGASWYEREGPAPVPASFNAAVDQVAELIESECGEVGTENCVIGGFSQGGFLALAVAGRVGAPRFAGVWAMCCALPQVEGLALDLAAAAGTPALIQVGEQDQIIVPARGRAAAEALREAGWAVTELGYDMGHSQTIEMMVDARTWLAQ